MVDKRQSAERGLCNQQTESQETRSILRDGIQRYSVLLSEVNMKKVLRWFRMSQLVNPRSVSERENTPD